MQESTSSCWCSQKTCFTFKVSFVVYSHSWHFANVYVSCFMCAYRDDDIEMRSNTAYGTVEPQYEAVSVPDKPQDGPIYL